MPAARSRGPRTPWSWSAQAASSRRRAAAPPLTGTGMRSPAVVRRWRRWRLSAASPRPASSTPRAGRGTGKTPARATNPPSTSGVTGRAAGCSPDDGPPGRRLRRPRTAASARRASPRATRATRSVIGRPWEALPGEAHSTTSAGNPGRVTTSAPKSACDGVSARAQRAGWAEGNGRASVPKLAPAAMRQGRRAPSRGRMASRVTALKLAR